MEVNAGGFGSLLVADGLGIFAEIR